MDKEFEKWLRQDDLFEFYQKNPDQQQIIFKDYQYEIVIKDIDGWLDWMCRNPELAEKHYPTITNELRKRTLQPYQMALLIQKLPEHFPKWKSKTDKYLGIKRRKTMQGYIDIIEIALSEHLFQTDIEQGAVESVREELAEQLEYWKNELNCQLIQQTTPAAPSQQPTSFDDLFNNPDHIEPCIQVLRESDLINEACAYIGRSKSAFVVWIRELERKNMIRHCRDKEYVSLLTKKFPGLDMTKDGSLFRKGTPRAEEKYKEDFRVILSQISQDSQKGK